MPRARLYIYNPQDASGVPMLFSYLSGSPKEKLVKLLKSISHLLPDGLRGYLLRQFETQSDSLAVC